jgi:hypothetical protein
LIPRTRDWTIALIALPISLNTSRKRSFSEVLESKMERSKRDCSNRASNVYYIVII